MSRFLVEVPDVDGGSVAFIEDNGVAMVFVTVVGLRGGRELTRFRFRLGPAAARLFVDEIATHAKTRAQ